MLPKTILQRINRKPKEFKEALANFSDQTWRMNNLYSILNDEGFHVQFQMNEVQKQFYEEMHTYNLILKARQQGFTTLIDLFLLDEALFTPNIECAIIAHSREDAQKILRRKVKYPYMHLPDFIRNRIQLKKDTEGEIIFSNGSVISSTASARSGTFQNVHISEFATICSKYPEKAREVVAGSIETLAPGQRLFIESTSTGPEGYFYDYCQKAMLRNQLDALLASQEFKFHFFGWYRKPSNRLPSSDDVSFDVRLQEYFEYLENTEKIKLDRDQKFWYMNKEHILGEDIKKEHPSTPQEAFEQSIEGTYFLREFSRVRQEQRITRVPYEEALEVHTAWDLGMRDLTAIWFFQVRRNEFRFIDYHENDSQGLLFYRDLLDELPYRYGTHLGPHDLAVRELGTGLSRDKIAEGLGIDFVIVPRVSKKIDAIQAARSIFHLCWFDEENCVEGLKKLQNYRKDWDQSKGTWKKSPREDDNAHAADAFLTFACGYDKIVRRKIIRPSNVDVRQRWQAAVGG